MHCQTVVARVTAGSGGTLLVALHVSQMQFRSYTNGKFNAKAEQDEVRCSVI